MHPDVKKEAKNIIDYLDKVENEVVTDALKKEATSALINLALLMKGYIAGLDYNPEEPDLKIEQNLED